uniref:dihydrodipicolinate synthase family protein n=1 Tax=Pararhizobium sp. IMCC3301 TaxID=3067904 RepID=UPI0027407305|nr:dihydrodipicolinate synthase family protein [Pararhizobium sp. IMCC3301]
MSAALTGILPVLPTPFAADGTVDTAATKALVQFAVEAGVSGVVFPGFASEVETLTSTERAALLKIVADNALGHVDVVAGASAATPAEVIEHGKSAAALGIQFLMIQTPKAIGSDLAPVQAFLSEVAEALPEAQIILQNAPAPRGSDLSPETILNLARAIPQIAYVKEETLPAGPAISRILENRPASLKGVIGGGGARYILDEYGRGACAAMPAIEIADLHVALDRAWRAGNRQQARDIYVKTLPLLTLQAVYRMRLTKLTMMHRGILHNAEVRAPTPEVDAAAKADILANLAELGIASSASAAQDAAE